MTNYELLLGGVFVKVNIRNIVNKFKMPISIMQTIYETITNSLEANAENIKIILSNNETTDGQKLILILQLLMLAMGLMMII